MCCLTAGNQKCLVVMKGVKEREEMQYLFYYNMWITFLLEDIASLHGCRLVLVYFSFL